MADPLLTFACPACGTLLNVPASLAGVSGPCPTCNTTITAPFPDPLATEPILARPTPLNTKPLPTPPRLIAKSVDAPGAQASPVRLSPRHISNREASTQPIQKPVAEIPPSTSGDSSLPKIAPPPKHRRHYLRFVIPLALIAAVAIIIFGVYGISQSHFKEPTDHLGEEDIVRTVLPPATAPTVPPTPVTTAPPPDPEAPPTPTVPTPPTVDTEDQEDDATVTPMPTSGYQSDPSQLPATRAMALLDTFIEATSLDARLPIIETKLPPEALADTVLAQPFPRVIAKEIRVQEHNRLENFSDVFIHLRFDDPAHPDSLIAARVRGNQEPRILADPWLDLFGGRIASFAATPQNPPIFARSLIFALPSVFEDHIPNRDRKRTIEIRASEDGPPIAKAYVSQRSAVGEMLADPVSGLTFGQPRTASYLLSWNTTEDPKNPYLEITQISGLDWNQ